MKKRSTNRGNRMMPIVAMFLALTMLSLFVLNAMADVGGNGPETEPVTVTVEQPADVEPAVEQPAAEEFATEQPAVEQPAAEQPAVEAPAAEQFAVHEHAADQPAAEAPAAEQPAVEEPVVEQSAVEPVVDMVRVGDLIFSGTEIFLYAAPNADAKRIMKLSPNCEVIVLSRGTEWARVEYQGITGYILRNDLVAEGAKSAEEEPAAEQPVVEELAVEQSATEEPVSEQSVTEEPVAEQPAAEEPIVEETVAEEPVSEQSAAEEPVSEQSAAEEPAAEQPAVEEPATEGLETAAPAPVRSVQIFTDLDTVVNHGDSVRLWAVLNGFEGDEVSLQWQSRLPGGEWVDIAGATSLEYTYRANADTLRLEWRMKVALLPAV